MKTSLKNGIGRKVAGLTIFAGILTAAVIFFLSSVGQNLLKTAVDRSEIFLNNSTNFETEKLAENEAKKLLLNTAQVKSYIIDATLQSEMDDVAMIADKMTDILRNPKNYLPRTLPNPNENANIPCEVAYFYLSPEIRGNPKILDDVAISSNIADDLSILSQRENGTQAAFFIGTEKGYLISADSKFDENENVNFTKEFLESYDPRTRPWYIAGKNVVSPTFTNYYEAAEGYPMLTVVAPFYDSQGFAGVAGIDIGLISLQKEMTDATQGETNFNIMLDKAGRVIFSSKNIGNFSAGPDTRDLREDKEKSIADAAKKMTDGERGTAEINIDGKKFYLAFAPIPCNGWSFGTLISAEEVQKPIQPTNLIFSEQIKKYFDEIDPLFENLQIQTYRLTIFLLIFMILIGIRLSQKFSAPIKILADGVKEISGGNLDKKIDIKTGDEVEQLSDNFNIMTGELKDLIKNLERITAEKERIASELNIAQMIQSSMLPQDFNSVGKNFKIFATMTPAKEVGGDFYDFYFLNDRHLVITIADVSDKGVPAALFMVVAKTILKNTALISSPDNLSAVVESANNQLSENNSSEMFVTVFIGRLDLLTGEFIYVNAGHNSPFIRHGKNSFSRLPRVPKSPMLGIRKKLRFPQKSVRLNPGDTIFLYTDGITEAINEDKNLFSEEKLGECLSKQKSDISPQSLIDKVEEEVKNHIGTSEQSDDITMLAVKFSP